MDQKLAKRPPRWVFPATIAIAIVVEFQLFGFALQIGALVALAAVAALIIRQKWRVRGP